MIEIKSATIEHAEMMANLNQRVQTLHIDNAGRFFNLPPKEEIENWFKEILAKPNTIAFLAINDKQAIGYILAIIHEKQNDIFTKKGAGYIWIKFQLTLNGKEKELEENYSVSSSKKPKMKTSQK